MINKMSFNNFKAFGSKMQTFSKKPITLVYGANSVGKSSFLHSMLYFEYIQNVSDIYPDINMVNPYFAGDKIDILSYQNFIHKREINRHIDYEIELNKKEDIADIMPPSYKYIIELASEGLTDYFNEIVTSDDSFKQIILDKLNNYQLKEGCYFLSTLLKNTYKQSISNVEKEELKKLFFEYNKLKIYFNKEDIFVKSLESNKTFEELLQRKDTQKFDVLDKLILFILDNTTWKPFFEEFTNLKKSDEFINSLVNSIDFYLYFSTIQTIKLKTKVFYLEKDKNVHKKSYFYIDNELFFEYEHSDAKKKLFTLHLSTFMMNYLKYMTDKRIVKQKQGITNIEIDTNELRVYLFYLGINDFIAKKSYFTNKCNQYDINFLKYIIYYFSKKVFLAQNNQTIQYIAPLRFYPDRIDLYEDDTKLTKVKKVPSISMLFKDDISKIVRYFKKVPNYLNKKVFRTLFISIYFIYKSPKYIKYFPQLLKEKIPLINGLLNAKKSNKNVHSMNGAKTSEKMWKELISAGTAQEKINMWLSDKNKLKTTYKIGIVKYTKNNFFRKLFRRKEKVLNQLQFIDNKTNTAVSPRDMGLGISQILPILVSCFSLKKSKIFLEQPELHLHPALQMEIADEFIRSVKENGNEFIIETHSEHLLLRIMKRMRYTAEDKEGRDKTLDLTPDDVCLLYVDNDGKSTYINELRLSKKGTLLDHWPNGFFEEGYKERFS